MRFIILTSLLFTLSGFSQTKDIIHLWPGQVPGETEAKHEAVTQDNHDKNVTRLTDVTDPILTVYEPDATKKNGAAIIICPGGGYNILAIDLEGYEIAEWLKNLGYMVFVLQYRVPDKQAGALADIQRAIRLVRGRADEWSIDREKVGILGFSAGGSLCARASTRYLDQTYQATAPFDALSCRPDFSLLIYPAYLDKGENRTLTPELLVDENTPPMFLFCTADDQFGNSALVMAGSLRDAKVPVELHVLPSGGHGYGLRAGSIAAETWPLLAEKWLNTIIKK